MPKEPDFETVFAQLKSLMTPYQDALILKTDESDNYSLITHFTRADGYQFWFGSVQIKKNYVSYHLVPVYMHPELLETVTPELRKRMQGKACFNFCTISAFQLEDLRLATNAGFEYLKAKGMT